MVVALIVIGVILFLAFDGWVLAKVMKGRASADDYGAFAVPGEQSVTLASGKLKVSYQESIKAPTDGSGDIDFNPPSALEVKVTDATGQELSIKGPGFKGMGRSMSGGPGWSRAVIGTIEITQPGTYTVTASPALPDAVEPQILIGK